MHYHLKGEPLCGKTSVGRWEKTCIIKDVTCESCLAMLRGELPLTTNQKETNERDQKTRDENSQ